MLYFVFNTCECRFSFYGIIKGVPRKVPLNDIDSPPYDFVYAF